LTVYKERFDGIFSQELARPVQRGGPDRKVLNARPFMIKYLQRHLETVPCPESVLTDTINEAIFDLQTLRVNSSSQIEIRRKLCIEALVECTTDTIPFTHATEFLKLVHPIERARIRPPKYQGALVLASALGDLESIKKMVDQGGAAHETHVFFGSGIAAASRSGHVEIVEYFLQLGGTLFELPISHPELSLRVPLEVACLKGHIPIVRLLLDQKGYRDQFVGNESHGKAQYRVFISLATRTRNLTLLNMFMEPGRLPSFDSKKEAFILAAKYGRLDLMSMIRSKFNTKDEEYLTSAKVYALEAACKNNKISAVKYLLSHKTSFGSKEYGNALHYATLVGHIGAVRLLLNDGADALAIKTDKSRPSLTVMMPLKLAITWKHPEILALLLSWTGMDGMDFLGPETLLRACEAQDAQLGMVRVLLEAGADPNIPA
jgi:ankyrin repeat protein